MQVNRPGIEYSNWNGNLVHLYPENQLLWLTCTFTRPSSIATSLEFEYKQDMIIDALGSNVDLATNHYPEEYETYLLNHNVTRTVKFKEGKLGEDGPAEAKDS